MHKFINNICQHCGAIENSDLIEIRPNTTLLGYVTWTSFQYLKIKKIENDIIYYDEITHENFIYTLPKEIKKSELIDKIKNYQIKALYKHHLET